MHREKINIVEMLETGELLVGLESHGEAIYEYVYREAAGVYWDKNRHGFKSTPTKEWSCSQWFEQIVAVVRSGLGVELSLNEDVIFRNISEQQKAEIQHFETI